MAAEHRKQVDDLMHALGERERAVDTMSAERKKDSEKWERERETHRQKIEDLQSHFAREREREEEREDQRDRERCASEEALKAALFPLSVCVC